MTSPFPSPAPRRLERSRSNRVLGGVCGGVATYLNMDPTLVRVLTVVLTLFTGIPVVVYLVLLFVVPEEGSDTPPNVPPGYSGRGGQTIPSTRSAAGDPVWGPTGAPWEQPAPTQPPPAQPAPRPSPAEPAAGPSPAEPAPGPSPVPPATGQREEPREEPRPNGELR
jgi:phage shock protein PspC (stress-responsive transcriptional regulator)